MHAVLQAVPLPYRDCVGIMLIGPARRVWVGRRRPKWIGRDGSAIWQMPQGGIQRGEGAAEAALRELREETGASSVKLLGELGRPLSYDLPEPLVGIALKGRYRGQRFRWFAAHFQGNDEEFDIAGRGHAKREFEAWRWVEPGEVAGLAIEFKRPMYEAVIRELWPLARSAR